jgi:hypothetical protein
VIPSTSEAWAGSHSLDPSPGAEPAGQGRNTLGFRRLLAPAPVDLGWEHLDLNGNVTHVRRGGDRTTAGALRLSTDA